MYSIRWFLFVHELRKNDKKKGGVEMLRRILRFLITVLGAAVGVGAFVLTRYLLTLAYGKTPEVIVGQVEQIIYAIIFAIIFAILFYRAFPAIGNKSKKAADNIESELSRVPANDLIAAIVGLVLGLLVAYLISGIYSSFNIPWLEIVLSIATYLIAGFLGIIVATRKIGKYIEGIFLQGKMQTAPGKKHKGGSDAMPKIMDTSVIIDGRILDILKTGFIEGNIVIPEFVLVELRHIADSHDALKRQRGRRGLDVLNKIQSEYGIEIYNTADEKSLKEIPEVDVKLLKLAQIMNGKVVTNDFNLNKVASIKGVEVLNINELANSLKPVVLPGEEMNLFLVKEGKESNQAVAYLDDGTMIVVEDGRRYIGKNMVCTVSSVLQTAAGRMIFAKAQRVIE
jgi:uncharacterized protein YacL